MKINEIFLSIDGEVNSFGGQGIWSTFIRFQGCNLNCSYCDTLQAQNPAKGYEMSIDEIVRQADNIGCRKVTITGGEPFFQSEDLYHLEEELINRRYKISIETNGSYHLWGCKSPVIMDYKLPSSGQEDKMDLSNFFVLRSIDYIKFVIGSKEDYDRAREILSRAAKAKLAFSPDLNILSANTLMDWMKKDKLFNVQLNVQLHKLMQVK